MHPTIIGNNVWLLLLAALCGLWQLQPTNANWQGQQNTNPATTQFGTPAANLQTCFEKTIFAKSRSPAAVSHMAAKTIKFVTVETLDDTYGGATVEIIGGAIGTVNIVLSIADGNRKSFFKSNIKVSMFCAP
ncbi:uncharacterized protein LOC126576647 [Anopheles aquasalis]|uniref:uncharacterized protein LOC126576647 n=1 Tax=Anopheles aquasalis TaxID=42839 RepID=UPI00215AE41B|nr:uncharacterized protein LOC126576647 [Anopheles aquasalis]